MSLNKVNDIVGPLFLGKKGVLWKHHCPPVCDLTNTTFSQKQLIGLLWNFIQIFGFLRTKKWCSQEKILFLRKSQKVGLFVVGNFFSPFVPFHFPVYMISFWSYVPKCPQPIRLQYFLSFNITKTIWGVKFLLESS